VFLEFKSISTIIFSLHQKLKQKRLELGEQQEQIQHLCPQYDATPKTLKEERFTFFNGVKSIYHVNNVANFSIANITYNSVQQYRQYCKA